LKKLKKLAESLFTNTKGWLLCQKIQHDDCESIKIITFLKR
jgi:hypothetical protein